MKVNSHKMGCQNAVCVHNEENSGCHLLQYIRFKFSLLNLFLVFVFFKTLIPFLDIVMYLVKVEMPIDICILGTIKKMK